MRAPRRAERLWLVMAVATVWVGRVGSQAEGAAAGPLAPPPVVFLPERGRTRVRGAAVRTLSCVRRRRLLLVAAVVQGQALPLGQVIPAAWSKRLDTLRDHPPMAQRRQKAA